MKYNQSSKNGRQKYNDVEACAPVDEVKFRKKNVKLHKVNKKRRSTLMHSALKSGK